MNNTNITTEERRYYDPYYDRPWEEGDWENIPLWIRILLIIFALCLAAFLVWACYDCTKDCCNGAPPPPAVFPPEIDPNVINDVENQGAPAPNNEPPTTPWIVAAVEPPAPAWIAAAVEQTQTKSVKSQ